MKIPDILYRTLPSGLLVLAAACAVELGGPEDEVQSATSAALPATADSWVRSASSVNSNKGTEATLYADHLDSGGGERRIFLHFTVPDGTAPVSSARIELHCKRSSDAGGDLKRVAKHLGRDDAHLEQPAGDRHPGAASRSGHRRSVVSFDLRKRASPPPSAPRRARVPEPRPPAPVRSERPTQEGAPPGALLDPFPKKSPP